MIDIENEVFQVVSTAVLASFPNALIVGKETRMPSRFPCVSIAESDNYTVGYTQDSGSNENHVSVMYSVDVYSNKANGSKTECKEILAIIDEVLIRKGFTRNMKQPISFDDATKYRITARYSAVVGKNNTIYRR
jgi:hypothetical protein